MRVTSPLVLHNRFSCLEVDSELNSCPPPPLIEIVPKLPEPTRFPPKPCWERNRVPRQSTILLISPCSLDLTVGLNELETTDTGSEFHTNALVDSGATSSFIDSDFVCRIATRKLSQPVPVLNVDGTPNEGGQIMEVVDLILRCGRHSERILLAVTNLGKKNLILGYTWLREHNPEINWETREVKLSRCPRHCSECRGEIRAEKVVPKPPSPKYQSLSGHRVCYATLLSALRGSKPRVT